MELNFEVAKILLVDDDENYSFALKTLLGAKGLNINSYTNPEEALEYLKTNDIDIILLDYYMPEMTGAEFLRKFREFNNQTIVFLQTAYSEEKPELEMLETLNIQGYIDKNKEPNEIFMEIASGIKMSELIKIIKQQEKQLDAKDYQNEFLGKFLNRLVGEMSERSMAMAGSLMLLEEMKDGISEKELFERSVESIKNSMTRLNKLIKSLEIKDENGLVKDLKDILNTLFEMTFIVKDVRFTIKTENEYDLINCNIRVLTYILVDIIEYLISINEKDINFKIEKNIIKIINKIQDDALYNKINKLALLDEHIKIKNIENIIQIEY